MFNFINNFIQKIIAIFEVTDANTSIENQSVNFDNIDEIDTYWY